MDKTMSNIYLVPKTLTEACGMLTRGEKTVILAGGTDLLVKWPDLKIPGASVISLKKLDELKTIKKTDSELIIGSRVTLADIESDSTIQQFAPFLSKTAANMASPQIRNVATIGGNLCNAAPSADMAPPLLVVESLLRLVSVSGSRTVPINEFFTGPGSTVMKKDEILESIHIPLPIAKQVIYIKSARRNEMDIATVGIAAGGDYDRSASSFTKVRIAFGAVAPTPIRAYETEKMLISRKIEKEVIEEASRLSGKIISPISNIRSSAEYRRLLIETYTKRALTDLVNNKEDL